MLISLNIFLKPANYRILNCRFYSPSALGDSNQENGNIEGQQKKKLEIHFHQNNDNSKGSYYIENKEKIKQSSREYYLQNKDKMKESYREYYNQNKEKMKELNREYRIQNSEKMKECKREYYLQNKFKVKESSRKYYLQNKDKMKKYYLQNKEKIMDYKMQNKDKIKESNREYRVLNKVKIKQFFINKNIERNNGIYVPSNSWKSSDSIRDYFEKIAPLLHIGDLSDWYRISRTQINEMKGGGMFAQFNSLGEALKVAYPDNDWDMSKFSFKGKKSTQRWLYVKLKKLIPNVVIEEEYNHPELLWEENKNKSMKLDIWVSEYNLALEYQGEHHYFDIPSAYGPSSTTQVFNERDEKKKNLCASKGIHLVCIPYWWDGHEDSLSSTLHTILPDVFHKTDSPPIPNNILLD